MSALRVLFVSFIPPDASTGMGRWTLEMAAALERAGFHTTCWFASDFPLLRGAGRLAVLLHPPVLAARLARAREAFDAVILHEPSGFWYGMLRRHWRTLPPLLVMSHSVESRFRRTMRAYADEGLAGAPSPWRGALLRTWQSDGAIRRADHVICLSTADRDDITDRLAVPASRVTRLVNGVSSEDTVAPAASRAGVLWVGGWLDVKGRRVLPRLWRAVADRCPEARLTLVGTGVDPQTVLGDFAAPLRPRIEVHVRVRDRDAMRALYARHALFLMTSLSEGSPLALLEAMAAGLPIVATAVGGIPDAVTDGADARLFDPRAPDIGAGLVADLLDDSDRARRLGDAARARAREHSWDTAAAAVANVIRALLEPERSP